MKKYAVTLCLLTVLLWGGLLSCARMQATPIKSMPDFPRDPALIHGELPNGFQYYIMKNATPKERVSVHLNVFSGAVQEQERERGIAHYLEHMVFNGSEHFKPGELVTYFQSIGMDFGGDANARTSYFSTIYDLNLPKGDKEHLEDGLLVLRDYAGGALLLQSEVDRERGVILAEKRERDSVSYRTFKQELAFELPGSLVVKRLPIGEETVLKTADRNLIKGFYDRNYRPDNMAIVMVGDVDPTLAVSLIKEKFSSLTCRSEDTLAPLPDLSWTPHRGFKPFNIHESEAGNTEITIEKMEQVPLGLDTEEKLKQRALETMADLMMENRLSRMISRQKAAFTKGTAYTGTYIKVVSATAVQVICAPEKWQESLSQLEKVLRQALTFGFTPGEFNRVRADFISSLKSDLAGAGTRNSQELAGSVLYALNNDCLFLSPGQRLDILKPFLETLRVETVSAAFQKKWQGDQRLVLVTGNADLGSRPLEKIKEVYNVSQEDSVQAYVDVETAHFPYLTLPDKAVSVLSDEDNLKGLGISRLTFGNQIRLNLKQTAFKKNTFQFKAIFGNGRAGMPKSFYGFSGLVSEAVRQSGLGGMDQEQLAAALAGREISFRFDIDDDNFTIRGSADTGETELVFQLLYAYFNDPGIREKGLDLALQKYRQGYEAMERTPEGAMQIRGDCFLAGGDSRFGWGKPEQAEKISIEDIRRWLLPNFAHAPLEVSLVGDFEPAAIKRQASEYLGVMNRRQRPEGQSFAAGAIEFPRGKTLDLKLDTQLDKGVVRLAFLTDDYWNITRTRQLSVLAQVFSERLRQALRESLGVTYSPYVYNNPSLIFKGYGVMQAVVNSSPGACSTVCKEIEKIAADLRDNGVTKEETELVKAPLMTHITELRQKNGYWLDSVLSGSVRHPEKLDWATHIVSGYREISAQTLSELAKKVLDVGNSTLIQITPQ